MGSVSATSIASITQNLNNNATAISTYHENLQKAVDMGYAEEAIRQWADGSKESMEIVAGAVQGTQADVENFNAAWSNYTSQKDVASSTMASIETGIVSVGNSASDSGAKITGEFVTPTTEGMESVQKATEEMATTGADTLKSKWEGVGKWFETNVESPLKTSIENIGTTLSGTLTTMQSDNETAWKNMYTEVEKYINQMQSKINSLQGKTFTVTIKNGASPQSAVSGSPAAVSPQALFSSDAANVAKIKSILIISNALPNTMENLTWHGANSIEKVLEIAVSRIAGIKQTYRYSGEIYAGEGAL